MRKMKQSELTFYLALGILGTILLILLIVLFTIDRYSDRVVDDGKPDVTEIDLSLIPTYEQLSLVMDKLVEEIYQQDYEELMTLTTGEKVKLPGTNVSFSKTEVYNSTSVMAITQMALERNPYLSRDYLPTSVATLMPTNVEPNKELLDGKQINLSELIHNYSGLELYTDRENPTKFLIKGYENGDYFESDVSLYPVYQSYWTN